MLRIAPAGGAPTVGMGRGAGARVPADRESGAAHSLRRFARISTDHDGLYPRAGNGLALKKFFGLAFGNIFEAGALMDPEFDMPAAIRRGDPIPFQVCGEEALTVIVGWDNPDGDPLSELLTMEGTYTFHARAVYGEGLDALPLGPAPGPRSPAR